MTAENIIGTAASASAILAFLAVSARWAHRWFTRLENAVFLVEHRNQQLDPDSVTALRDDVRQIQQTVESHSQEFTALHQTVSSLAVTVAAEATHHTVEGG